MDNTSPAEGYTWNLRVRHLHDGASTVYARNNAFTVGPPASFRDTDPNPSAVEYLLGALGADLTNGFSAAARELGIQIDALELALSGRLANPLVVLGVIGEGGEPHFVEFRGILYVSADAGEDTLQEIWRTTLERSPLANTLKHSALISIRILNFEF